MNGVELSLLLQAKVTLSGLLLNFAAAISGGWLPFLLGRINYGALEKGPKYNSGEGGKALREPELTFPADVAEFVIEEYRNAEVILEYGSGGSTVLAARLGKRVFSVESDPDWSAMVQDFMNHEDIHRTVTLHHADIGKTAEWGRPKQYSWLNSRKYLNYASSIWRMPGFQHPDLILIDGRFRVGCFLTSLSRVNKPTRILFDDYWDREWYSVVQEFCHPVERVGRMAVFWVDAQNLSWQSLPRRLRYSTVVT